MPQNTLLRGCAPSLRLSEPCTTATLMRVNPMLRVGLTLSHVSPTPLLPHVISGEPSGKQPDPPEAGISYDEYYAGVLRGIYKPPFAYGGRVPTLPRAAGELPRVDVSRLLEVSVLGCLEHVLGSLGGITC